MRGGAGPAIISEVDFLVLMLPFYWQRNFNEQNHIMWVSGGIRAENVSKTVNNKKRGEKIGFAGPRRKNTKLHVLTGVQPGFNRG